jgi:pyruvate formate lyase activating enzyme
MLVKPIGNDKLQNSASFVLDGSQQKGHPWLIPESDLFDFLKSRVNKLDAVVITGGEPTIHKDLPEFITKIKKLDYRVKLDTNGSNPEMIKKLIDIKLIDYLAMDIKAPAEKYNLVSGIEADLKKIKKSIKIIKESNLPYEFRTTVVPGLIGREDIKSIGSLIKNAAKWYLQQFKPDTDLVDKRLEGIKTYTEKELAEMSKIGLEYARECKVR